MPLNRAPPRSPEGSYPLILLLLLLLLPGCATARRDRSPGERPFLFGHDTFAYANELVWEYRFDDATGQTTHRRRDPPAKYAQHCFVMAKAARQFFQFAEFVPGLPRSDAPTCRQTVRKVLATDPSEQRAAEHKFVFPGYTNLFQFSREQEALLKRECGGGWRSYFQRGHWRMIFPFSDRHQAKAARELVRAIQLNRPPVIHVVRFPQLSINHALLLFAAEESAHEIRFSVYDPNVPDRPATLTFDRQTRRFHFPRNAYFAGGRVDIYEIYRNCWY